MKLYRGQPNARARARATAMITPWLHDALQQPEQDTTRRASGRWFTDDLAIAQWYEQDSIDGEIVTVDVPDRIALGYLVAIRPVTTCGLQPGRFSRDPDREYFLPRDLADRARPLWSGEGIGEVHRLAGGRTPEI